MIQAELIIEELRALLGRRVRHSGAEYRIVELLEDEMTLVLQAQNQAVIQPNQFGDAHRRVQRTVVVPIRDATTGALSAEWLALVLIDEVTQ